MRVDYFLSFCGPETALSVNSLAATNLMSDYSDSSLFLNSGDGVIYYWGDVFDEQKPRRDTIFHLKETTKVDFVRPLNNKAVAVCSK